MRTADRCSRPAEPSAMIFRESTVDPRRVGYFGTGVTVAVFRSPGDSVAAESVDVAYGCVGGLAVVRESRLFFHC